MISDGKITKKLPYLYIFLRKITRMDSSLYVNFVDYEKAFESVDH